MAGEEYFCDKPITPLIIIMAACTAFIVAWVVMNYEDLRFSGETEEIRTGPVPQASHNSLRIRAVQPVTSLSRNHQIAGITHLTPDTGIQFAAKYSRSAFQDSLKDAVNSILPSVCDIHAIWVYRSRNLQWRKEGQTLQFLPPFDGTIDKFIQNRGYENIGAGTLVDGRGYVLTNFHVVQDASDIKVTVPADPPKDYSAEIVAEDAQNDLALLKLRVDGDTFPEAPLGDSSFVEIGDVAIAVGSPFGMEQTVTSGIISGLRRSIRVGNIRYKNLFQTDAPINRGSSGGPLVNLRGEVIGVNTAIYAPSGSWSGTGFAIPINEAKRLLSSALGRAYPVALDKKGIFSEPVQPDQVAFAQPLPVRFGLEVMTLDPVAATQLGVEGQRGVLVNRVFDDYPASIAGIRRGDIITSIAGVRVQGIEVIPGIVSHFKAGDTVNMRVVRNGKRDEVLVRLW